MALAAVAMGACGGGGEESAATPQTNTAWQPAAAATPASGNYVYLSSEPGEHIGQGRERLYTASNADLSVGAMASTLLVHVRGAQIWSGAFALPASASRLMPGQFVDLQRHPFHDVGQGGLTWTGDGRGCNTVTGWLVVDRVAYTSDTLSSIELRFEQQCEGDGPVLHGKLRWSAADATSIWGPLDAQYSRWQPPEGTTPTSGNYVFLQSEYGDFIGAAGRHLYTQADALLTVTSDGGHVSVLVNGNERWYGDFMVPSATAPLQTGLYDRVQRYPLQQPAVGGLSWWGEGRGCNTLTGWFVIDRVAYSGNTLTELELRFEQRCEDGAFALRGKVRWSNRDITTPPGPANPPPPGLWSPAPGVTPDSGNFVFLHSDAGDYVGAGMTALYTPDNAALTHDASANRFGLRVEGDTTWFGNFEAMQHLTRLEPGYYPDLRRYPFHNPAKGGLDVSGHGRGCNVLTGWFVVDGVTYTGDVLTAIDLRFEQHCEEATPALRGRIRWSL